MCGSRDRGSGSLGARRLSEVRDPRGSDGEEGASGGTEDWAGKREWAAGPWPRRNDEAELSTVALLDLLVAREEIHPILSPTAYSFSSLHSAPAHFLFSYALFIIEPSPASAHPSRPVIHHSLAYIK